MTDWLKSLGEDVVSSALVKLAWLGLVAFVIWKFAGAKVGRLFWFGYAGAALVLLWLMSRVNPVAGDKVYSGDLQDYAEDSATKPGGVFGMGWKNWKF